ncbi:TonB-dependent receptor [Rhodanobacter sp. L36]|uniref:TonB-dependent receptor n=1 Tax=Rhodanobacter sp. L36 TaxID=1747221 RepID=UPI00131D337A|nr:TonB-dependent receptor [Rhodanobacter sp. L36]
MKRKYLYASVALVLGLASSVSLAQSTSDQTNTTQDNASKPAQRASVSSTSNTTTSNDTKRVQQLSTVQVQAQSLSLAHGLMSVQTAPKAVSTITRDAIVRAAPGATFVQMIDSIPGVNASTDDYTGLANGNYSIRGYTSDEIGTTVNGAPINDSGNYKVYSTEYGDTENMGDITVLQGYPDVDTPIGGAAGGSIAWVTIDPSHTAGLDVSQTFGSNDYRRTFFRLNTGDTGPVRSWLSYSDNRADLWRGPGEQKVTKIDGKSIWTIDDNDSISASFQYNREFTNTYESLTKAQAQTNYNQNYDRDLTSPTDTNFYKLHTNPFRSWLVSLDGEFKLSDDLRLSVVPYFQYGLGGGGGGATFTESTSPLNYYQYANQDLNGNGTIGGKALAYSLSSTYTMRPGVIAKLNQDFGENNSLEYGFWWERPRQEQSEVFTPTADGVPSDNWAKTDLIRYPDGLVQTLYNEYTTSETRKVFATDTWTPNDQWTITAGASYLWVQRKGFDYEYLGSVRPGYTQYGLDGISSTYHKVTPTAGVKYQLNEQNQFYFGAGRTFRAPINGATLQNAAVATAPGQVTAANNFLNKPEISTTGDLGWRFYNDTFSASVDAYASNFTNKQISGFDEYTFATVYLSLPKVHMRGLNTEASYKISDNWSVYGSYAYTQAKLAANLDTQGDGIYNTDGKILLNTPKNTAYVRLSYDQGPFWASLDEKYRGPIWGDWSNTQKVGGYATLNLNTGWNFPDFSTSFRKPFIKVNLFNITDRQALTNANNISSYLAANPSKMKDDNGTTLFASEPYYSLLEGRTLMVTFGASFF